MNGSAIKVKGLTKQFGSRRAVDGVSFDLPRGAFLAVLGPNGAGKTTLLRILSTLVRPSAGEVEVAGFNVREDPDSARALVGFVSHDPMLYPDFTAMENLAFYARLYGVEDPEARALELLDVVGMKSRRLDRVRTLSRGMTQRVAIARALVNDPAIVLLDEPCAGLDSRAVGIFDELIASIRADRTFVMVGHDFAHGIALADHALVLSKGRLVRFGRIEDGGALELSAVYREAMGGGAT